MENPASSAPRSSAPVARRRPKRSTAPKGGILLAWYGTRRDRQKSALKFRREHHMSSVLRYHIQAGAPLCSGLATSFRLPWVSLHGIDSICVVARSNDICRLQRDKMPRLDLNPELYYVQSWSISFWNAIISEVEDIAAVPGDSRQRFKKSSKKPLSVGPSGKSCQNLGKRPFGVVSMIEDINETSSDEYDVGNAIKFIQEELESSTVFTFDKTAQTAVSAFQHLFRREFEADEIRVSTRRCVILLRK